MSCESCASPFPLTDGSVTEPSSLTGTSYEKGACLNEVGLAGVSEVGETCPSVAAAVFYVGRRVENRQ